MKLEEAATEAVSKVQLEEAGFTQKQEFIQENLERVEEELERVYKNQESLKNQSAESKKMQNVMRQT